MEAPSEFVSRLTKEFGGRLRIRWSNKRGAWMLEQKVGRSVLPKTFIPEDNDELIRARDGYWFFMEIRPGTRMPCPKCGLELQVPIMDTAQVTCDYCRLRGKEGRYAACYFPLGDALIQHIRRLDPTGTHYDEVIPQLDAHNQALLEAQERQTINNTIAATAERFNRIVGIPTAGLGGIKRFE